MNLILPIVSTLLLCVTPALAGEFGGKNIKHVTPTNFKKVVFGTDKATMAVFYAPWCGHCKQLSPQYQKAADNMAGLVNFVAIDCDVDANKPLCGQYEVKGFPTIKAFGGKGKKVPDDYMGERKAGALVKYMTEKMPSFAKRLKTPKELADLLEKPVTKPQSILFTSSVLPTPLYKALSTDLNKKMDFWLVKDSDDYGESKEKLGVEKAPALVVWQGEGVTAKYDGKFKYEELSKFYKNVKVAESKSKDEL